MVGIIKAMILPQHYLTESLVKVFISSGADCFLSVVYGRLVADNASDCMYLKSTRTPSINFAVHFIE
jgi:hypothetical protein